MATPIGCSWASQSWKDGVWADNTWACATPPPTPTPSSFRIGGEGNYDPYYWDRIRKKREEEEIVVVMQ
jgi:hypothetical protein